MTIALTHIALHVEDVSACVDFYASYAGMQVIHERPCGHSSELSRSNNPVWLGKNRIVWLSEPGQESQFIIVLIPGGREHKQQMDDYSHLSQY
ncbi:VOC family protein [Shewanella eurypsychrophilus]|uniref:VOC family protein n=1 Tax=Shewanella eurypsychrophilus TaxID=2593656 RepID=A0ABX8S965_9GAMM|nr:MULTISPECIES: VOC family protein [Shewanella]QXP44985.1 VOC family protein [Shewanella eurypsychrophilus]